MNEHDGQRLERYFDGELGDAAELEAVRARVEGDLAWGQAYEVLEATRDLLRGYVLERADEADLEGLWGRVAAASIDAAPVASWGERLLAWWGRHWTPVLVSAAAAAVVAFAVTRYIAPAPVAPIGVARPGAQPVAAAPPDRAPRRSQRRAVRPDVQPAPEWQAVGEVSHPPSSEGEGDSVTVDSIENDGTGTVLITVPTDEGGATVIWLLEEDDSMLVGEEPI